MIKLGTLDITLKVGSATCTVYLGDTMVESGDTPTPPTPVDYSKEYLTFVAKADGTFTFSGTTTNNQINTLSYSLDNGTTWTALANNTASPIVTSGNKILWKGTCTAGTKYPNYGIGRFLSTAQFDVEGNIMSLLYGDNYKEQTDLTGKNYAFGYLFSGNTNVVSVENLSLPATTLSNYCYYYMFENCTSLTTAPELPATTLSDYCYSYMFENCTSLTTAPELPATTLSDYCYSCMFIGCTSLAIAPELPASTLTKSCYNYMFTRCTSLTTAPVLSATTLANSCYRTMFSGCTSLTIAPELPASTLTKSCYENMFKGCSNLNSITCLATDGTSEYHCTDNWVVGVAANGIFVKSASMSSWSSGGYGIPSGWVVQDYVPPSS